VAKVLVDNNQASARQWGVMSFPTLVVFKGGKAVDRVVGFTQKANLVRTIQPYLA
jgi:thioredoxin 1